MQESRFINVNGNLLLNDQPVFHSTNRAFLYGDAIFESMISVNGNLPLLKLHIDRLLRSMQVLKMRAPFSYSEKFFAGEINALLRKNRFFKWARVRMTVFRNDGGLYTPATNEVSYLIDVCALDFDRFALNSIGYNIDIFKEHLKPINNLSSLKSTNDLLYILAGLYKKEKGLDDCVLLNEQKYICESISSNIFLVKGNKVFTPSLESGCLPGVMRKKVIELIELQNIDIQEVPNLTIEHLKGADECFLTNAVNGVKWVSGYREIRYFNKMSAFLVNELNKSILKNQGI